MTKQLCVYKTHQVPLITEIWIIESQIIRAIRYGVLYGNTPTTGMISLID